MGARKTGPPEMRHVLALADAIADGLSALHEAGVVHRDVKPANILFQLAHRNSAKPEAPGVTALVGTDERILLGDLGIAKDLIKKGELPTLIGGTPLYRAPEQGDEDGDITPAADIYAATALLWHIVTGQRPPSPSRLQERMDTLPELWRELFDTGLATVPESRFADMEAWRSAVHSVVSSLRGDLATDTRYQASPTAATCPYKGLAAYQPEDARYFFGREILIDELVRRLQRSAVLVVGGPSGSGKSSLVRAGLVPALRAGALPNSKPVASRLVHPRSRSGRGASLPDFAVRSPRNARR